VLPQAKSTAFEFGLYALLVANPLARRARDALASAILQRAAATTLPLVDRDKSATGKEAATAPKPDCLSKEEKQAPPRAEPYSIDGDIQPVWPVLKSPDQDSVGPLFVDRDCRHDSSP
jgi:hypothetical protein